MISTRSKNVLIPALALGLGLVLGVGVMKARPHPSSQYSHLDGRKLAIQSHADLIGSADTVLIGDSLVENAVVPSLCGGTVLNAGIGGAKVADLDMSVLGPIKPKRIIIAVGVNDAVKTDAFDAMRFATAYSRLLDAAALRGGTLAVGVVDPIATQGPLGADHYSRPRIAEINQIIHRLADKRRLRIIDFPAAVGVNGELPLADTADGVHLRPSAYKRWVSALDTAC